ncbi:MAG: TolC family protein [Planctomycetaceae bacterium]|nr:TolC family protein [Planctomycetaceae bacterium]
MATRTQQHAERPALKGPRPLLSDGARKTPPPAGPWGTRLAVGAAVLFILAGAAWGAVHLMSNRSEKSVSNILTTRVLRSDLIVTVTEDGSLESAVNIDIKCEVAGGTNILWIVEDGKEVKKGEKIIELDSAALEESINQQRIATEKARAAKIQAEKDYAAAKLAVDEYLEGTFVKSVQDQDAQITIAEENLRSAQNALEHSERMFRKGYISALDLESQRFQVQRAQLELDSAQTAKEVLVKFTKIKMLQELESKRDSAEAKMRSEGASFDLEESRLKRLETQLEKCVITAPADGMAVFANEQGARFGGSTQSTIEEGAAVRERQTMLRLPDLSQMQVKVNVHESKVEALSDAWRAALDAGLALRARIRIQDLEVQGYLASIANQPEPSGWWAGNIKEYATIIAIDGTPVGLRPGMTAECEILVQHLPDVLTVPVAAVVEQRGAFYVWTNSPTGPERRPVILGATNDQFIEVKDGLVEGEEVILNPRAAVAEARAVKDAADDMDVDEKFGQERQAPVNAKKHANGMPGPPAGGPGTAPGPGAGGPRPAMNPMQYDKDGDGKLTKDEAPAPMQAFFDQMDTNGDGAIDSAELAELRRRMEAAGGPGGPGGPGVPGGKTPPTGPPPGGGSVGPPQ